MRRVCFVVLQLRRDAEFIGAVQANERRKRDEKLDQGYKRFIKLLHQDKQVIHQLKTSGNDSCWMKVFTFVLLIGALHWTCLLQCPVYGCRVNCYYSYLFSLFIRRRHGHVPQNVRRKEEINEGE